mmetsp:Transcript_14952/g.24860  ORF Transcript_14952/g.24860 Transcript_14952/m.24860 type:complete len:309 (-) Transcript_14952:489-1415(-)
MDGAFMGRVLSPCFFAIVIVTIVIVLFRFFAFLPSFSFLLSTFSLILVPALHSLVETHGDGIPGGVPCDTARRPVEFHRLQQAVVPQTPDAQRAVVAHGGHEVCVHGMGGQAPQFALVMRVQQHFRRGHRDVQIAQFRGGCPTTAAASGVARGEFLDGHASVFFRGEHFDDLASVGTRQQHESAGCARGIRPHVEGRHGGIDAGVGGDVEHADRLHRLVPDLHQLVAPAANEKQAVLAALRHTQHGSLVGTLAGVRHFSLVVDVQVSTRRAHHHLPPVLALDVRGTQQWRLLVLLAEPTLLLAQRGAL